MDDKLERLCYLLKQAKFDPRFISYSDKLEQLINKVDAYMTYTEFMENLEDIEDLLYEILAKIDEFKEIK